MIPRLLHQTWKTRDALPAHFADWRRSFFDCNPGLESRFYDDASNRALLAARFPALLPLYDSFPREIFRVDMIRAVYLFEHGGLYADLDFQCLRPLDRLFAGGKGVVLGMMGTDESFSHCVPNAMMASAPGEGFWLGFLANVEKVWARERNVDGIEGRPEWVTGPVVLRRTLLQYRRDPDEFQRSVHEFAARHALAVDGNALSFGPAKLLPSHVWYPLNWNDRVHYMFKTQLRDAGRRYSVEEARRLFPSSAAVTWWSHSWL